MLFASRTPVPVYACVPRKAGTHLLQAVLQALGMRCYSLLDADAVTGATRLVPRLPRYGRGRTPGFVLANVPPPRSYQGACEAGRTKIVLGIRDPRAVFLSTLDFLDNHRRLPSPNWHPVQFFRTALGNAFSTREELAAALLDPTWLPDNPYDVGAQFARCRLLYHHPGVLKVRYETLVHAAANGDDAPLRPVCDYLGLQMPADGVHALQRVVGGSTATRNQALADRWKTELPPAARQVFMDRYRALVAEFGYPVA